MPDWNIEEKVYLVSWAIAHDNREESRRLFYEKYNKEAPTASVIRYWCLKFLETGSLVADRPRSGRPITAATQENKENVLMLVQNDPTTSHRLIADATGYAKSSVHRIMKSEKLHPFKPSYCQKLYDGDSDRRMQFCKIMGELDNADPALTRKLVFSDECHFELSGRVNKHNIHFWHKDNPHEIIESPVHQPSVTVWAAIGFNGMVSYDVQQETMNGQRYCRILEEKVIPNLCRQGRNGWYFQQDGAPPHYSLAARELLNTHLPGRWIGRRGAIEWPARSPDLTPLDYWFWSYIQSKVYNPPGTTYPNRAALQFKIEEEMNRVPLAMYRDALRDFLKRCRECLHKEGEHFE